MRRRAAWKVFIGLLAWCAAAFTAFALVATAITAWHEHSLAQWPRVMGYIRHCGVDHYRASTGGSHAREGYQIRCQVSYLVGAREVSARIASRVVTSPNQILGPESARTGAASQIERMQQWVDQHPPATTLTVHYDPADYQKAVLIETDMPLGSRTQTPGNLKVLGLMAAIWLVLLLVSRIVR